MFLMPFIRQYLLKICVDLVSYQQVFKLDKYTGRRDNGYFAFRYAVLKKLLCQKYGRVFAILSSLDNSDPM